MDRIETYVGQSILEWCFSKPDQNKMVALSKLTAATLGTGIIANGLACTATGPASMFVNIGAGELYQSANLENTACGTLPQDLTHQIMKQGILLDTLQVPNSSTGVTAFAAPGSSGQSINYLIEATYSDSDVSIDPTTGATNVVLPFYNSSNPQTPYNGPGNTGASSNTFRKGVITFTVKAGAAATTGTQTTPTVDSGYVGLWVVTVPFGASTLTSANIAQYAGAPILPSSLLASIQSSNLTYGVDGGSANTVQAKFPIPVATLTDGLDVWVKIAAANTGATTFTPNPGVISASPVIGAAHAALQGGELVVGGRANLIWRQDVSSWVLVECTGAAIQVAPATASQHAVNLGQFASTLGINGYTKLPNGLIIQFGQTGVGSSSGATTVTYPLAFPNGLYGVTLGAAGSSGSSAVPTVDGTPNATSFPFSVWNSSGSRISGLGCSYIAIGH